MSVKVTFEADTISDLAFAIVSVYDRLGLGGSTKTADVQQKVIYGLKDKPEKTIYRIDGTTIEQAVKEEIADQKCEHAPYFISGTGSPVLTSTKVLVRKWNIIDQEHQTRPVQAEVQICSRCHVLYAELVEEEEKEKADED